MAFITLLRKRFILKLLFLVSIFVLIFRLDTFNLVGEYRTEQPLKILRYASDENKKIIHLIKRLESPHNCECRAHQTVKLIQYSGHGKNRVYNVSILDNEDRIIRSYELGEELFDESFPTCSPYHSFRRGPHQKVIGYSLYGNDTFYYRKIANLTRRNHERYPGWVMRIFYDSVTVDPSIICQIECAQNADGSYIDNADFCDINKVPFDLEETWSARYMHGMTWRWLPLGDPFVDRFISRDTDSVILERELASVQVWLNSGTLFHIMRDHKDQTIWIIGGMWGLAVAQNRSVAYEIFGMVTDSNLINGKRFGENLKGLDQHFLAAYVWPLAKDNATIHDSYLCQKFKPSEPFPTRRLNPLCSVAMNDPCDENLVPTELNQEKICPIDCRPKEHQDWIYC